MQGKLPPFETVDLSTQIGSKRAIYVLWELFYLRFDDI